MDGLLDGLFHFPHLRKIYYYSYLNLSQLHYTGEAQRRQYAKVILPKRGERLGWTTLPLDLGRICPRITRLLYCSGFGRRQLDLITVLLNHPDKEIHAAIKVHTLFREQALLILKSICPHAHASHPFRLIRGGRVACVGIADIFTTVTGT